MSFASEAAFIAPPRAHFDFSGAVGKARKLWEKRILPNLRDDLSTASQILRATPGFVYKKTAAFGVLVASTPLVGPLWIEKNCDTAFDNDDRVIATMKARRKARSERTARRWGSNYIGRPTAALVFLAALAGPSNFSTRSYTQDYKPDFSMVSQSQASGMPTVDALPLCPIEGITTREACGAEINRRYHERRARQNPPVEVSSDIGPVTTQLGPAEVVTMVPDDEHGYRDFSH